MQTVYKLSLYNAASALLLCLYLIAVGALVCRFGVFRAGRKKGVASRALAFVVSAVFLALGSISLISGVRHFHRYQTAMRNDECRIVEGTVEVLELGSVSGKGPDERIRIGTNELRYAFEGISYHWVIRKGGPLTNGVYTRLHVFNGRILKVEIKR